MTKEDCIKLAKEYEDAIWAAKPARHMAAGTGQILLTKNDLDAGSAWGHTALISSYYYLMAEDYKKVRWLWELLRDGDPAIGRAEEKHVQAAKTLLENFQNPEEFSQMRQLILTDLSKIFFEVRAKHPKDLISFSSAIQKGTEKIKEHIKGQKTGLGRKKAELVVDYTVLIPGLLLSAIEFFKRK